MPKLADVAELNPSLDTSLADDDDVVAFMPMAAVDADSATAVDCETRRYSEVRKGYTPFRDGDILVAKITPCFENGKIAQARLSRRYGFGSTEFHVVRPRSDRVDARYLVRFLRQEQIRKQGESRMTGSAGQRRVPEHFLAGLAVPLPSLADQRRIADILDKADELRANRRIAFAQLDTLNQSIFLDMFGDPGANMRQWPLAAIGEHARKIGSGSTPRGGEEAYKSNGITLIRSMNVRDGAFLRDGLAFIDEDQASLLEGVVVEADDLLLNITGASVARVCRAPADVLPARVNQHVMIIRPTATFGPHFLEQCLLSASMKERLLRIARAGATREAITKPAVEQFRVIRPPRDLQDQFAARVRASENIKRHMCSSVTELDSLFASLQNRAFRGDL
jgi:type I restriction enzyme, S subunit